MTDTATPKPAAIVFDVDGTLITGSGHNLTSMTTAAENLFGVAVDFAYIDEIPHIDGQPITGWIDRQFLHLLATRAGHNPAQVMDDLLATYTAQYAADLWAGADPGTLIPGIPDALRALADNGIDLGMATGNAAHIALMKMAAHGLDEFFTFDPALGFGDHHENRAAIGAAAVTGMGPDVTVYLVGDQRADMTSATANNAIGVGVLTGAHDRDALLDAGAHIILDSVISLPDALDLHARVA